MRLNHLDLLVRDVPATVRYFERYFGLQLLTKREASQLAVLGDGHGFTLVLQHADAPTYPAHFHLGFLVDDPDAVRSLQAEARAEGTPVSDVIVNGRGTMAYFHAPDGYYVEVSCQNRRWP